MKAPTYLLSLALVASAAPAFAQSRNTEQSFSSASRQSAEEVEDIGEIREVGEGDPKGAPEPLPELPKKFRFSLSTRAQYTSNAQLSGNHSSSDFLFFPTLEAGYHTELKHGFSFDIAARLESGLYAKYDERAFIGYSATTTLDWRPKPNAPRIFIGAEPYRYDSFDSGDLLTQAVGLSIGTDHGIAFNGGNSMAFVGYNFTHYLSDPSKDERGAHRAIVGVTHTIRPQLYGQVFYAFQHDDYTDFDRDDNRHVVGVSFTYQVNRNLFTTLSGSFIDNDSSQDRASYQSAGAALQFTFQY